MNSNTTYNYLSQRKPSVTNFIYLPSALDSGARTRIFIQIDCDSPIQIDSYFHPLPTPQVRRPVTLLRPRGHDNRGAPLLCQPRFQASNWRSFNRYRLRFGLLFSQRDLCQSMQYRPRRLPRRKLSETPPLEVERSNKYFRNTYTILEKREFYVITLILKVKLMYNDRNAHYKTAFHLADDSSVVNWQNV